MRSSANTQSKPEEIKCPFCGEDDFDLFGLKIHLLNGWCEIFNSIEDRQPNEKRELNF